MYQATRITNNSTDIDTHINQIANEFDHIGIVYYSISKVQPTYFPLHIWNGSKTGCMTA